MQIPKKEPKVIAASLTSKPRLVRPVAAKPNG